MTQSWNHTTMSCKLRKLSCRPMSCKGDVSIESKSLIKRLSIESDQLETPDHAKIYKRLIKATLYNRKKC